MPQVLQQSARDGDTFPITISFYDVDGVSLVVPTTIKWTLKGGNPPGPFEIINGRENVVVAPSSTVTIVPYGPDLLYTEGKSRTMIIDVTFTSTVLGLSDLPIRDSVTFGVTDV